MGHPACGVARGPGGGPTACVVMHMGLLPVSVPKGRSCFLLPCLRDALVPPSGTQTSCAHMATRLLPAMNARTRRVLSRTFVSLHSPYSIHYRLEPARWSTGRCSPHGAPLRAVPPFFLQQVSQKAELSALQRGAPRGDEPAPALSVLYTRTRSWNSQFQTSAAAVPTSVSDRDRWGREGLQRLPDGHSYHLHRPHFTPHIANARYGEHDGCLMHWPLH